MQVGPVEMLACVWCGVKLLMVYIHLPPLALIPLISFLLPAQTWNSTVCTASLDAGDFSATCNRVFRWGFLSINLWTLPKMKIVICAISSDVSHVRRNRARRYFLLQPASAVMFMLCSHCLGHNVAAVSWLVTSNQAPRSPFTSSFSATPCVWYCWFKS